ncbi:MAG: glycosyltransferase family 2 protein [Planctomycetota bacterium]
MSVRACIVAYRSGARATAAARSALDAGAEVVVVNNSPEDAIPDLPDAVRVVAASKNLGFAAGSNLAAEGAETDHLLFLNPDATIPRDGLAALIAHLDGHPEAAIAGPSLSRPDGRAQPSVRRDPSAAAILHQYTAFRWLFLFRGAYRRYRSPEVDRTGPVDVLMGSVLLVRASVFRDVGGFDDRYFMYFEEADLCRRVRDAGHEVVFVAEAAAVHEGGASAALNRTRLAAERLISAQRYLKRFLTPGRWAAFRAAFLVGFPLRAMIDLLRDLFGLFVAGVREAVGTETGRTRAKALEVVADASLLTRDFFRVVAG